MPVPPAQEPTSTLGNWLQISVSGDSTDHQITPVASVDQAYGTLQARDSAPLNPAVLGPLPPQVQGYELQGELGRGGMGVVYKARQLGLNRLVALKMILTGPYARPEDLARFRAEAEAVAQLQHPHIVQVHEIGELQGMPFFSLEYVDGGSLDHFLAGQPQPPLETAAFVEKLARAMQVAHDKGIVHRDLKPANILLALSRAPQTRAGDEPISADDNCSPRGCGAQLNVVSPKITDFGLAKRLQTDSGHTRTGEIIGTPCYMAPEQAAGEVHQTGPAVDIYALGAILYEMLTGRPPFKASTPMETVLLVLTEEVLPPRRLIPKLPVDLETICLKCLHKELSQRYASALALAEDLRRFQKKEPILARPLGRVARLWRWCRRNPAVAGLLVAVLFSLAVGTAVSSYFAVTAGRRAEEAERHRERADNETREAVREKQRADANYRRAREAVQQYLTLVSQEQRLKEADFFVLRKKLLDTALPLYRELLAQVRDDPALVAERREALTTLADIEGQIGNVGEATRAYRELLTLLRKQVAQQPGDQVLRAKCILTHANLGIYLHRQGKLTEAEQLLRQGLELAQQYATDQPHDTEALVTLARGKAVLTHVVADLNQPAEAERLLREEISTYAGLARQYPKKPALWEELGHAQTELGTHLIRQGRLADAEKEYLAGRRFWEQEGKTLTSQPARQAVAGLTYQLSKLYTDQGRWTESERENKACLAMLEPLTQEFPSITRYRLLLGLARTNYAFVLEHSQRLAEAEQQLVQAQQLIAPLAPPDGLDIKPRQELGRVHQLLGGLKLRRGQPQEAQQHYRQALAIYLDLTQRFPALAELQHELAAVYLQTGNLAFQGHNFDAAMREYRQCLALLEKLVAANPTNLNHQIQMGGCLCNMGHISMERGHLEDALRWYDRAARILGNVLHRDGRSRMARQFLRNVQLSRTRVLLQLQRPLEALDASEQAYTLDDGTLKALLHQQQRRMVQQLLHQGEEYLQRGEKPQLFILVERLAKMAALAPDQAFTAANLCAGALAETTTTPADRFTNLALTFLAKAQQVGYFQRQGQRGLILSLPAFATLRLRPEFATWLREQK